MGSGSLNKAEGALALTLPSVTRAWPVFPALGLQAPGSGRSPTPGSRSQLQQLLQALLEESRRSDPRGFGAEDQHGAAAARSEASLRAQKPPAMRNSDVKASADPTPSAPSFLLEAKAWGGLS